jgi:hypothetical protein
MADFALWAAACEGAFRPAGTLETAYSTNRRDAIENIVDADPVAAHVREIMAEGTQWRGSASDLLQVGANRSGWPKSPRALAGRLRRAQTFLRTLGIETAFGREGRFGTRTIRITAIGENQLHDTVSTVSRVSDNRHGADLPPSARAGTGALSADDADGADANSGSAEAPAASVGSGAKGEFSLGPSASQSGVPPRGLSRSQPMPTIANRR